MSTYTKAQEDGRRKRAKFREDLRIKFAGDALTGYLSKGFDADNKQLVQACIAVADEMVRALGYAKEIKPSPLSDEEKAPVDDGEGI